MSWTSLRPAHRIDALVKKPARRRPNATPAGSRRVSAVANSGTYVGFRGKNGRVNCRGRLPKVTHSRPERLQHRCWSRVCRAEIQDVAASPRTAQTDLNARDRIALESRHSRTGGIGNDRQRGFVGFLSASSKPWWGPRRQGPFRSFRRSTRTVCAEIDARSHNEKSIGRCSTSALTRRSIMSAIKKASKVRHQQTLLGIGRLLNLQPDEPDPLLHHKLNCPEIPDDGHPQLPSCRYGRHML
jgi:hypothetical protein